MVAPVTKRFSLQRRLFIGLVGPLAILFLIAGVAGTSLAKYFADSVYDGWLFDSVSSLALEVERRPDGPFVDMPPQEQRLFVWDAADKTYFRITASKKGILVGRRDLPGVTGDVDRYQNALLYDGVLDGEPVRIAALVLPASTFGETVRVEVAETTRKRSNLARTILLSTLIPQLLLIIVAIVAIRRAVRSGLVPLGTIASRLKDRSDRELSPISDEGVPEEVQPMTRALNDLLARLHDALAAQRRFVADAAHQLRTPLTAIKLQTEQAKRECRDAELLPHLETLARSTDRATRLSNQLLSLARAEPDSRQRRPFKPVDLVEIARQTGAEWVPKAIEADIEMQFSSPAEHAAVWVSGDRDLLCDALANLLDNAIKYGRPGGRIEVRVAATPTPAMIVEDNGPGIPAAQREKMLGRFVRGSAGDGSGLGLSIALEIVQLHRGDLTLNEGQNGTGLAARLTFPSVA